MADVLIVYSTTDGHTVKICRHIAGLLPPGDTVRMMPVSDAQAEDIAQADKILIGASIRYGRHKPEVAQFFDTHHAALQTRPTAFFSVSVVARKPTRNTPETNLYARKFLAGLRRRPDLTGIFAGRLAYARYGFFDRAMIRLIMYLGKGPTAPDTDVEFTDWQAVERFAREFSALSAPAAGH